MTKFAVAMFPDEKGAHEGVAALKDLHQQGIVSVYETVVARREDDGRITFKHRDKKRIHTIAGLEVLLGGILGSFMGPAGTAGGLALGGAVGWMLGYVHKQFSNDLIENIAADLKPGSFAVVAEISEQWNAPLDDRIEELGGSLRREGRRNVIEDLIAKKLNDQCRRFRKHRSSLDKKRMHLSQAQIKRTARVAQRQARRTKWDVQEKIKILRKQRKHVNAAQRSRIEKRMAQIRDEGAQREQKLWRARAKANETLHAESASAERH